MDSKSKVGDGMSEGRQLTRGEYFLFARDAAKKMIKKCFSTKEVVDGIIGNSPDIMIMDDVVKETEMLELETLHHLQSLVESETPEGWKYLEKELDWPVEVCHSKGGSVLVTISYKEGGKQSEQT